MAKLGSKRQELAMIVLGFVVVASGFVSTEESVKEKILSYNGTKEVESGHVVKVVNASVRPEHSGYVHVWPDMKFGWKIVVGAIIGFIGAAFGTVGGVGGGGIFVPMLTLIIKFDPKSSTAISKCMVTGAAGATVYYNLRMRHPTLELPIIDYDLALLFQPMLILGISIGVAFNVIFANWMLTVLLILIFLGTSTKSFLKGVETWKKETIAKKEAARSLESNGTGNQEVECKTLPPGDPTHPGNGDQVESKKSKAKVSIIENVFWKELGLLFAVWVTILGLQIAKNYTTNCSVAYWILNFLQIPVAVGVSTYEAVCLYKGRRVVASRGHASTNWKVHQLVLYCVIGVVAGLVGGLLGLGGGFILGPLFLEMGVPPQVSSATATFIMTFSASMSVVEYYLLRRFPVPYALYFFAVATIAGLVGQLVVTRAIKILGRASIIIFILASTIFLSAILLGGIGLSNMIKKIERKEYMGFENICKY